MGSSLSKIGIWLCVITFCLLPLSAFGQGQVEGCIDFEDIEVSADEDVLPQGWTFLPDTGNDVSVALVQNHMGFRASKGIRFASQGYSCLALPDMGLESYVGWWLQFHYRVAHVNCQVELGAMSDAQDATTFVPLDTLESSIKWRGMTVDLSALPAGYRHLAFRSYLPAPFLSTLLLDDVHLTQTPCWAWDFRLVAVERDTAFFEWEEAGSPSKDIIVHWYIPDESDTLFGVEGQRFAMPIEGGRMVSVQLVAHTCDSSGSNCGDYYESMPRGVPLPDTTDCVDISLLYTDRCTPYYGNFHHPYAHEGFVYYHDDARMSRHWLCTDTAERDRVVGAALRTIPEGETASVRLGNDVVGGEAEGIRYSLTVDTARADMLILKYAGVMQNSSHRPEQQPRFRIELLDEGMQGMEPAGCHSYDFIASSELGWNVYGEYDEDSVWNEVTLWKDWTTVGIDLSPYHGERVHLRLTTFDCSEGGHYGYAYYTLGCAKKRLEFLSCTMDDSNRVAAPEGFNYRWWRDDAPEVTVSTSRETTLPADNETYHCTMAFIGDTGCTVTMDVRSRMVAPEARFDFEVGYDSCRRTITFHNRSHLVGDTTYRGAYTEWLFDDGTTSMLDHPVRQWDDTGSHVVTLVSGLGALGGCFDTVSDTLRFLYSYDTVAAIICAGSPYHFHGTLLASGGTHTLPPLCDSVHTLHLTVLPAPEAAFAWEPARPVDIAPQVQFINYTLPEDCHYRWFVQGSEGSDTLEGYQPEYRWEGTLPTGDFEVTLVASRLTEYDTIERVCSDTARHTVTLVTSLLQFPNLVTPNGDGVNDRWEIVNLLEHALYPINELWIYNSWGVLVYHVVNLRRHEQFWDPAATKSPDGTYFYRFSAKNRQGIIRRNGVIEVMGN